MFWVAHSEIIGFSKPKNWKSQIPLLMWKIIWFLCTLCWVGFLYPLCPHPVSMSASTLLGRFFLKKKSKILGTFLFLLTSSPPKPETHMKFPNFAKYGFCALYVEWAFYTHFALTQSPCQHPHCWEGFKKKRSLKFWEHFSLSWLPHHPNLRPIWNFPILQSVFLLFCPNPKFEISYFPLFEIRNLHFLKKISLLPLIVSHFRLTRSRDYWFNKRAFDWNC